MHNNHNTSFTLGKFFKARSSSELRIWLIAICISLVTHTVLIGLIASSKEALLASEQKTRHYVVRLSILSDDIETESDITKQNRHVLKQPNAKETEITDTEKNNYNLVRSNHNTPDSKGPDQVNTEKHHTKPDIPLPASHGSSHISMMSNNTIVRHVTDDVKKEYIKLLIGHIAAHKYYPHKARRRGIEGIVEIYLDLSDNGDVKDINTSCLNKSLCVAASQAIQNSQPLPAPPPNLIFPLKIQYSMKFELR